jgi:hypothetical protein
MWSYLLQKNWLHDRACQRPPTRPLTLSNRMFSGGKTCHDPGTLHPLRRHNGDHSQSHRHLPTTIHKAIDICLHQNSNRQGYLITLPYAKDAKKTYQPFRACRPVHVPDTLYTRCGKTVVCEPHADHLNFCVAHGKEY